MSIPRKVRSVQRLFDHLDTEIKAFQNHSNIHCISGCGKCCTKPDIEASPLEFLPWSFYLFINNQAHSVLEQLNEESNPICILYNTLSVTDNNLGRCSDYIHRGLICRLFGYAATRDKWGKARLITCQRIKEEQTDAYKSTVEKITNGLDIPVFTDYYMRLSQIDYRLGNTFVPINTAMKIAIEEVLHYYAYRPFPRGFTRAA